MSQLSGFTKMGFSKRGFSCCGRFTACDMGKGACALISVDEEAKDYCWCYQHHHNPSKMSEAESLFHELDGEEIDKIFSAFPLNPLKTIDSKEYNSTESADKQKGEDKLEQTSVRKQNAFSSEEIEEYKKKEFEKISAMSDYELLEAATKRWVQMSGERRAMKNALQEGDYDNSFNVFKRIVNNSGSGGGSISFMCLCGTIEIKGIDGRLLKPSVKELFNIYKKSWELENEFNLFSFTD